LAAKAAGDKSIDDLERRALTKAGVGLKKWVANNDATTNHQWEWHRRAAAGKEGVWGQHGDEGV
jgi:hypothetical protein